MIYGGRIEDREWDASIPGGGAVTTLEDPSKRVASRGEERPQQGSAQQAQGLAALEVHPQVDDDLDRLPTKIQDTFHERVDQLRAGQRHSSTHPLHGPLKGWQGTSIGGSQHRIVHRFNDGALQVIAAGSHDQAYDRTKRRMNSFGMGQAGPDYENLRIEHRVDPDDESDALYAIHPHHGDIGRLSFYEAPDKVVEIGKMDVHPNHRRRGVASALMTALHNKFPGQDIDHGERTEEGKAWANNFYHEAMGQAGPDYDNLSFEHREHPLYPSDNDFQTLHAVHPNHGDVGRLTYRVLDHPEWSGYESPTVHVTMMHVPEEHRRRGVASQLMNHLENHLHPDTLIDHGDRRTEGHEWAKDHYNDSKGGRTNFHGEYVGGKSQFTKNGQPWNIDTKKPYRMPKRQSALSDEDRVSVAEEAMERGGHVGRSWHVPSLHQDDPTRADAHRDVHEFVNSVTKQHGIDQHIRVVPKHWDLRNGGQASTDGMNYIGLHGEHTNDMTLLHEIAHVIHRTGEGQGGHGPEFQKTLHQLYHDHIGPEAAQTFGGITRQAIRFTPDKRVFTHTCGLDHRLWDDKEKLKSEVRSYVMKSMHTMWDGVWDGWQKWARVYFAGSEASEWTDVNLEGNGDFDVLVGVDYDKLRDANPTVVTYTNAEITDLMNHGFREFNGPVMIKIDGVETGPWDRTTYVNPDSYDIRRIKPYAAYDVGANEWVVRPPHLPHWSLSELPKAVQGMLRAADSYARHVLKLPEPERTQQGAALFDSWHSDRSRAFSEKGEGWWDIANLREKWLDQAGVWAQIVNLKHQSNEGLDLAKPEWSNIPKFSMGQAGPDYPLEFDHMTGFEYGAHPDQHHHKLIFAKSPEIKGRWLGHVHYEEHPDHIEIHNLEVKSQDQRRGVASGLMAELEKTHPNKVIDHGIRTQDGGGWAKSYYGDPGEPHSEIIKGKPTFKAPRTRDREVVSSMQMMRPSELEHVHLRDDLDQPWHRHKLDDLKQSITENGYVPGWGGSHDVTVEQGPQGLRFRDGNHRIKVLRELGNDSPIPVRTALAGDRHYGKGLDSLFSDQQPVTSTPFSQAGQRKDKHSWDQDLVTRSITHPHEFPMEDVDTRELHATQPQVVRAGVQHYMEHGANVHPDSKTYGEENGGDRRMGNDVVRVYHRLDDDQKFLLTGHHRATAQHLKGEPVHAMVIRGGWGKPR